MIFCISEPTIVSVNASYHESYYLKKKISKFRNFHFGDDEKPKYNVLTYVVSMAG